MAQPVLVQGAQYTEGATTNGATASPGTVTAGNTIIPMMLHGYQGCVPTVPTDNLGNTYTLVKTTNSTGGDNKVFMAWSAPITTGGACTTTLHASCSTLTFAVVMEWTNITASPLDGSSFTFNTTNPGTVTSGNITTTAEGVLIGMHITGSGGMTFTVAGGSTLAFTGSPTAHILEYLYNATAGTFASTATSANSSSNSDSWGVNYKASGAAAAPKFASNQFFPF